MKERTDGRTTARKHNAFTDAVEWRIRKLK